MSEWPFSNVIMYFPTTTKKCAFNEPACPRDFKSKNDFQCPLFEPRMTAPSSLLSGNTFFFQSPGDVSLADTCPHSSAETRHVGVEWTASSGQVPMPMTPNHPISPPITPNHPISLQPQTTNPPYHLLSTWICFLLFSSSLFYHFRTKILRISLDTLNTTMLKQPTRVNK